jgi:hypothetical protein
MKDRQMIKILFIILAPFLTLTTIFLPAASADMTTIFGPVTYTRAAGSPQTFTETFSHCGTASCQIVVNTGTAKSMDRTTSASISINGSEIIRPNDFRQQLSEIIRPVVLEDHNILTTEIRSKPGSFLVIEVQCTSSNVTLASRGSGVNLLDADTLLSALRIRNFGTEIAENVEVTSIALTDGTLTSPLPPLNLDTIPVDESAVLNLEFSGDFNPLGTHTLTVEGTYVSRDATYCFNLSEDLEIPPAAPGNRVLGVVNVTSNINDGFPYEIRPPAFTSAVNPPRWIVPVAPFVPGTPTELSTGSEPVPLSTLLTASIQNATPVTIFEANTGGINGGTVANTSTTAEPSGASDGNGVVFVTGNWFASFSTDGGNTFTPINPTAVFPADTVGYCCDQIVQYVPSIDRFIWLLQGSTSATQAGGYRLASSSPAQIRSSNATAWTYWNLTPQVFGQPNGTGFDYPDMSVGNNYLYLSWDAGFGCPTGCTQGFQVARILLSEIQAGGTIGIGFTNPADGRMAWGAHISQNTLDEVFWAGHNNNSSMRVFTLAEDSNSYFWRDVGISSWPTGGLSSTTPDGQDWLTKLRDFPGNSVHGLTRVGSSLWFAWSVGTNENFQQPHVEMVTLNRQNDFDKIQQVQIWNNDYAFAYPALSTNFCTSEVGLSLEYGGNGNYENHVIGFWGDFVVYITTGSDVGTTRYGDYVTIRQEPPTEDNPGNLFSAFGYGLNSIATGTQTDVRYVLFGRPASRCIIIE